MSITALAGFGETLLAGLSQTPTIQLLEKYAAQVTLAVIFKQTSLVIDGYTVSIKQNSGAPQSFTLGAAFQAIENIAAGQLGTFTSGVLEVDIQKN